MSLGRNGIAPKTAIEVWEEPFVGNFFPIAFFGLSGADQLRLFLTGKIGRPPIAYLVGMRPTEIGVGSSTFTMPITDWLRAPQGPITGGVVAILADGPLGCAVQSVLPGATPYTTAELSINMVRPVPSDGMLVGRGRVVHSGRRLGLSEVFVTDDSGRLIAHGTSRCVILPTVEGVPPPPPDVPDVPAVADEFVPPYARPIRGQVIDQATWDARSGLDIMRAHIAGELLPPPIHYLLGCFPVAADEGTCAFTMPATGWLCSPSGLVEGGITACLADLALAGAIQTTLPAGTALAPTDLRVQFIRPVPPDGKKLTARAQVVHRGRTVSVARGEVTNAEGKLVALATGSALILPGRRADLRDAAGLGDGAS